MDIAQKSENKIQNIPTSINNEGKIEDILMFDAEFVI